MLQEVIKPTLAAIFFLLLSGCASLYPNRLLLHTGIYRAPVKGEDIRAATQGVRFELDTAPFTNLAPNHGRLDIGLEFYGSEILYPDLNYLIGVTPTLRYSYPLTSWLSPYVEAGAGPAVLGLTTNEQEKSGFTFNDQIGAGIQFRPSDNVALIVGYRFGHLSHGGLRTTQNKGIETDTVLFGFVLDLP